MNKSAAAIIAGTAMVLGGFLFAPGAGAGITHGTTTTTHVPSTRPAHQESFCHRTGSVTMPYTFLTTSVNGIVNGHSGHTGPIFPARGPDGKWGDIIPPFSYSGGFFPGLNWPAGAGILANHCRVPGTGTTTTGHQTTTTEHETTTTHKPTTTTTAHETTTTEHETTTTHKPTTTTTAHETTTTHASTTTTMAGTTTTMEGTTSSTMATTTTTSGSTTTTMAVNRTLLSLRAVVINTHGGTATPDDFDLEAEGPVTIAGRTGSPAVTFADVQPGTYQLLDHPLLAAIIIRRAISTSDFLMVAPAQVATDQGTYTASNWECAGSASQTPASVTLDAGEDALCVITFVDQGTTAATTTPGAVTTPPAGGTVTPTGSASTGSETALPAESVTSTSLPNTGYDPSRMLEVAGTALILGGAGVTLSRRRKRQD